MRPINHFPTMWAIRVTILTIIVHSIHTVVRSPAPDIYIPSCNLLNYGLSFTTPVITIPAWVDILLAGPVFGAMVMALFCFIWQVSDLFGNKGELVFRQLDSYFLEEILFDTHKKESLIEKITSIGMAISVPVSMVSILYFIFNFIQLPTTEHLPLIILGPLCVFFVLHLILFTFFIFSRIIKIVNTASVVEIFCKTFWLKTPGWAEYGNGFHD